MLASSPPAFSSPDVDTWGTLAFRRTRDGGGLTPESLCGGELLWGPVRLCGQLT